MDAWDAGFEAIKSDVMGVVTPLQQAFGAGEDAKEDPTKPKRPANPARKVQEVAGAIGAATGLPLQLLNTGFALATQKIAAVFPEFPAATMGTIYLGPPHGHLHPPSLIPPNPVPVPLPSMGPVLLGTSVRVLIEGKPAARAGDIGMAVTCCGLVPAFEIKTGSSNVFIGGMRAARQLDFCMECAPGGGAMNALGAAMMAVGMVAGLAGAAGDSQDSAASDAEGNAAMASAQALSAAMSAAQVAADAAAMAIKMSMGTDIAVPPSMGVLTMNTASTVQIGGFPMINLPDPLHMLFEKLAGKGGHNEEDEEDPQRENEDEAEEGNETCEGGE
jgi:uncharacterized Zn-binding protein involved in type VI secretion